MVQLGNEVADNKETWKTPTSLPFSVVIIIDTIT
jgi:hypothetical protein